MFVFVSRLARMDWNMVDAVCDLCVCVCVVL